MKSLLLIGEAGSGKTHALKFLIPYLSQELKGLNIKKVNDRNLFEEEVIVETRSLAGPKRIGIHSTGYYNESGNLISFFVHDNELNRRVMRRLIDHMSKAINDSQSLLIAEVGVGTNNNPIGEDPFRWSLEDRISIGQEIGIPFNTVADLIVITTPYELRYQRQLLRPDKTPEEAFSTYSGEGGLPTNFEEIITSNGFNYRVVENTTNEESAFHIELVNKIYELRPEFKSFEGNKISPEGQRLTKERRF